MAAVWVFSKEASAREIARFVSKAARRHGRPVHFISDHARCFTGRVFRHKLWRLGVKQRFGAIGKKGSIALIERLWRTLKDTLGLRLLRPAAAEDLAATVELGLVHYAHFRPIRESVVRRRQPYGSHWSRRLLDLPCPWTETHPQERRRHPPTKEVP